MLNTSETFMRSTSLIQWTEHFVRAFEAVSKSQQKLVWSDRAARFAIYDAERMSGQCSAPHSKSTGEFEDDEIDKSHAGRSRVCRFNRRQRSRSQGFNSASFAEDFLQRPGAEPGSRERQEGRQAGQRKARLQGPELLQGQGRLQVGGQRMQRRKLLQGQGRVRNRWFQEAPVIA